jgi:CRP-like cAMP-binding protein
MQIVDFSYVFLYSVTHLVSLHRRCIMSTAAGSHPIPVENHPTGKTIFEAGEQGTCMYIVKNGTVDLIYKGKLLSTVEKGGIFGEMALIDFQPRSATALARTDCQLIPVDERHFSKLVQETPAFALQVMRVLVQRLRAMNESV